MFEAQPRATAAKLFSDTAKAAGSVASEVITTQPLRADMDGTPGWEVQVSGTEDGAGVRRIVAMSFDAATGEATKMGEGAE